MNLKQTAKHFKLYICFAIMVALFSFVPAKAQAATYRNVIFKFTNDNQNRTKVGNYYFWGSFSGDKYNISVSKSSKAKTGKVIASVNVDYENSCYYIVTNGSQTYYFDMTAANKYTLYRVDINGKNKKKIGTMAAYSVFPVQFSNNRLYYAKYTSAGRAFGSFSIKTKKAKDLIKKYDDIICSSSGGRYVYIVSTANTQAKIRIFDCQKNKIKKTHSMKKKSSEYFSDLGTTANYFYSYIASPTGTYKIYRCAANGSGSPKLIKTLKCFSVDLANDSYIYYYTYKTNSKGKSVSTYYRYKIKQKKSQKISETTYTKAVGWS